MTNTRSQGMENGAAVTSNLTGTQQDVDLSHFLLIEKSSRHAELQWTSCSDLSHSSVDIGSLFLYFIPRIVQIPGSFGIQSLITLKVIDITLTLHSTWHIMSQDWHQENSSVQRKEQGTLVALTHCLSYLALLVVGIPPR
ncbi:hypothetical protein KIW84_041302 [Lathyrus oleraceus]|uniref:Uncharacterized protein n=1 Tax=Pisum sativum TaxID=3888 RepID=A0A9D5AP46_PEA|nr:hypothetical protein KIW84_041302 [Pisum sativum]